MDDCAFEKCQEIASCLNEKKDDEARDGVIRLLDYLKEKGIPRDELVNHLIRETGLFPYLDETANWRDALVADLFRVDVGCKDPVVLHREQSKVLKALLSGRSVVVNAPTSFGKSFVIDALISIRKPTNVIVIVPTLALTDETRRRLFKKFSNVYRIISTADEQLGERNILIFPQERASAYYNRIRNLDLLIIDEFYKADSKYDTERSGTLISVLAGLRHRAKQCYFLMPNIDEVNENLFTKGMAQISTKFQTVVLDRHHLYEQIGKSSSAKKTVLKRLVNKLQTTKSLVYARAPREVRAVAGYIRDALPVCRPGSEMLEFADWVGKNYASKWGFVEDIRHGVVQHNGTFHRSLAQLCVKMFDRCDECHYLVATSSLIEGVNTSAENVILWSNKKGLDKDLDPFSFRNIMGRSGRMFRYFVGHVYELAKPPDILTQAKLDLEVDSNDLYEYVDEEKQQYLTDDQIKAIKSQKIALCNEFGKDFCRRVFKDYTLGVLDPNKIRELYQYFCKHKEGGIFASLQSMETRDWEKPIKVILKAIFPEESRYQSELRKNIAAYINAAAQMDWQSPFGAILSSLARQRITIDAYFKLERYTAFKVSSCMNDVNVVMQAMGMPLDLTPLIKRISSAFLPSRVYDLEEYGLPRMLSKKIHEAGVIDLETEVPLAECVEKFQTLGKESLVQSVSAFDGFDQKIINHFYDGITCSSAVKGSVSVSV